MEIEELVKTPKKVEILNSFNEDTQKYFKWFLALTEIPHPTFACYDLSKIIQTWLTKMGVKFEADKNHNILIHLDSNGMPDTTPTTAIQAHIDMVWVGEYVNGNIGVSLIDGKLVAEKSTLGADDGFGVALILELVERRNEIPHPPLELLLTIDEEMGLIGIKQFPAKDGSSDTNIPILTYKYFINCDALCGESVYIGSSGGIVYESSFLVNPIPISSIENFSGKKLVSIDLTKCTGGHSGQCIVLGRANAIKIIGRLLNYLIFNKIEFMIAELNGGEKVNIIAPFCQAKILVDSSNEDKTIELLNFYGQKLIKEFVKTDSPDFHISSENSSFLQSKLIDKVLSYEESRKIISFITLCPSGVIRMSPLFEKIVDTSNNLSIIKFEGNEVKTMLMSRSITKVGIDEVDQILRTAYESTGLEVKENIWIAGVPWEANSNSRLAKMMVDTFEELYGERKTISVNTVTIEPPQLIELGYTEGDMISICPDIPKAHMVGEFMGVEDAMRWRNAVYKLLTKLID
ncbi:Cytosol non-specific dipeptidase [Tritrichomonas foetus]|uniref:Cytosol non-specific dipeptidase n=1 Tax=Tritrichomonas foetus TaxID=1144522 RepID=A0A1J4KWS0_9EUKA|nr:Cytosol non-specific dipeptidase [Tritrichomonas foetus]|eukprot:OHT14150.1 Cytosol non-specific dipeptidase [Tritrichomonas foetus]